MYSLTNLMVLALIAKQSCGEDLYDDFIENRPGAAAELEAHLNKVPSSVLNSPYSSNPTSAVDSVFSPANCRSPMSPISEWPSPLSASPQKSIWQDQSTLTGQLSRSQSYRSPTRPYNDALWVYTCVSESNGSTRLKHLNVSASKVSSDRDLALALSNVYAQTSKSWLRLRGLLGIRFVQVGKFRSQAHFLLILTSVRATSQSLRRFVTLDHDVPQHRRFFVRIRIA
jgi:hypothetical protein